MTSSLVIVIVCHVETCMWNRANATVVSRSESTKPEPPWGNSQCHNLVVWRVITDRVSSRTPLRLVGRRAEVRVRRGLAAFPDQLLQADLGEVRLGDGAEDLPEDGGQPGQHPHAARAGVQLVDHAQPEERWTAPCCAEHSASLVEENIDINLNNRTLFIHLRKKNEPPNPLIYLEFYKTMQYKN